MRQAHLVRAVDPSAMPTAATGAASLWPWPRWTVYAAMGMLACLLVLATATGVMGADDLRYSRYAQALMDGEYRDAVNEWRRHNALRYGVIIPVAAVYSLFGVTEWSTMILPIIASTLSVVLLVEIGRRMFSLRVGIIAGLLYATFPLRLIFGAVLIPELISECWVLLAAVCYLQARQRGGGYWLLAGLLMGIAYLTKEPALFIGGAFLLYAMWEREWRGAALFAAGVGAVGAVEIAYYTVAWGDPLFRLHVTQPYTVEPSSEGGIFTATRRDMGYFLFRKYPEMMIIPHLKFGLHSLLSVVGAAVALTLRPRRGYLLLVLWIVIPALYLNFGSFSFQRYAPVPRDERYIEFLFPPLLLLTAVALARAFDAGRATARAASALLGIVMVAGVASGLAWRGQIAFSEHMSVLREIVRSVQMTPGQTIYTADPRWERALRVFDASLMAPSPDAATFVVGTDALGLPALERAASEAPADLGER